MITGAIAILFIIAMVCAGSNGEWGSVAVGAVIVVVLLALVSAGRDVCRAHNNFVDYWANGGPSGMQSRSSRTTTQRYSGGSNVRRVKTRSGTVTGPRIESETLKARYAPIERSKAYKEALARKQAEEK